MVIPEDLNGLRVRIVSEQDTWGESAVLDIHLELNAR